MYIYICICITFFALTLCYTSFFFFLLYMVFIHVIVHVHIELGGENISGELLPKYIRFELGELFPVENYSLYVWQNQFHVSSVISSLKTI